MSLSAISLAFTLGLFSDSVLGQDRDVSFQQSANRGRCLRLRRGDHQGTPSLTGDPFRDASVVS